MSAPMNAEIDQTGIDAWPPTDMYIPNTPFREDYLGITGPGVPRLERALWALVPLAASRAVAYDGEEQTAGKIRTLSFYTANKGEPDIFVHALDSNLVGRRLHVMATLPRPDSLATSQEYAFYFHDYLITRIDERVCGRAVDVVKMDGKWGTAVTDRDQQYELAVQLEQHVPSTTAHLSPDKETLAWKLYVNAYKQARAARLLPELTVEMLHNRPRGKEVVSSGVL
jgi:hypothetical protein